MGPNKRVVWGGKIWVGAHIAMNDSLPDGTWQFQKQFWNRKIQGIPDI